jgi:Holliday junction resolvasome RuvABC endonuclease subunit
MEQLRLIGLDLSVNGTGVCLPDGSTLRIKGKASEGDWRLPKIRDHVRMAAKTSYARVAVIEGLGHFKGNTQIVMSMVHGAVRTALMDLGVPYVIVSPSTLKLFATGSGGANKERMAAAAKEHAGVEFESDDECDAWWLWRAGLDWYCEGGAYDPLAFKQCNALDAVRWVPAPVPIPVATGPETAVQRRGPLTPGCPACEGWGHIHKGCILR